MQSPGENFCSIFVLQTFKMLQEIMSFAIILGTMTLLLLLPDAYILFCVIGRAPWWGKLLFMLPTLVFIAAVSAVLLSGPPVQSMLNWIFRLLLCIVFPLLIFTLLSLSGRAAGLFFPSAVRFFDLAALGIAALWLCCALYGLSAGWKKVSVEPAELRFDRLPESFDGYRIVHLSDFHIGTYVSSPETVSRIVREVNSLHPDLVVFTGDLVNVSPEEAESFIGTLAGIDAHDGVLSVLGNHDYCLYRSYTPPDSPEKALARVVAAEKAAGWRLLRNEHELVVHGGDSIAVIGVDNAGSGAFPDKSNLSRAIDGLSADTFKILLSHDPSHWRREVLPESDIDLTLSGHTHAMQFRIGRLSPSKWLYPEWGGLYEDGMRKLYVSTGIGENIPFRLGAWPQIVLITLRSSAADDTDR